ncbi:SDR family oxidoreductase [Pontibacillus sp. HMF3514]|uniref:SDR family oxidoreductase n=1 Tax=Pontibacillus sp. HMF3514 TaxID=2692425 RepID=UPI00131F7F44|nr:SDR family oxidoreductase [Pontibacillus sp. HMF3514]QHE53019.1 SDR family NAD(P)-dependent oxidoreductase [Pontibacillus sp. HMF3514]
MLQIGSSLKGKVAVVTGGSGVLGSGFCEALASCGVKVAVLGRTQEKLNRIVEQIISNGGTAIGVQADVLRKEELIEAKTVINNTFGSINILINAAGGNHPQGTTSKEYLEQSDFDQTSDNSTTFFDLDTTGVEFVMNLNFLGTLLPSQVFAKDMVENEGSVIVNISSMNAFTPLTKIPAYSGAKSAVSNFTQWLAVHLSKVGIRVNAIAPGFFLTDQNRALLTNEDGTYTERATKILSQTPMERFGRRDELTGTLLWLVDEKASSFVNGVVVPVDGGFSAYSGV